MIEPPETRYATTSDGLHIAYQVEGAGPLDLVDTGDGTLFSIDATGEQPRWQQWVDRLASFSRLIRFDLRGVGLSDPVGSSEPPTIEHWAVDAFAVMDSVGVNQAAILGCAMNGLLALLLAASHPERVRALVLVNAYARVVQDHDYPIGYPSHVVEQFIGALTEPGSDVTDSAAGSRESQTLDASVGDLPYMAPSLVSDAAFASWWDRASHRGASPAASRAVWRVAIGTDLRAALPLITVPTLVVHSTRNAFVPVKWGRYLAEHIPNAQFVEFDTADHVPWASDADIAGEIEEFLTGTRQLAPSSRMLATVLFTDIVGSTEHASAVGDRAWKDLLENHDRAVERQLRRYGGQLVKHTGDGVLAIFDGPARAVQCAGAVREALQQLGLQIRAGLHTGEVERRGEDVSGIAVHLAQRVQSKAEPGEILVSRTVVDLVAGSDLGFEDKGEHELKGVPGSWKLFTVKA
ncbi:MAG TPA: adenylate/guanylate cyclase domain-containing protein [Acidimicrobiales bacterium]|nr:adenylate/guanylate cyclase domain-containing protein [Acidimicrobiales bacterium]